MFSSDPSINSDRNNLRRPETQTSSSWIIITQCRSWIFISQYNYMDSWMTIVQSTTTDIQIQIRDYYFFIWESSLFDSRWNEHFSLFNILLRNEKMIFIRVKLIRTKVNFFDDTETIKISGKKVYLHFSPLFSPDISEIKKWTCKIVTLKSTWKLNDLYKIILLLHIS